MKRVFICWGLGLAATLALAVQARQEPQGQSAPQTASKRQGQKSNDKELQKRQKAQLKELESPYKQILQEDLAYIIMPEEREAFLNLSTNEEREQFIEQFWLRRDPTPDTIENEFKEEHYRRIAYANELFTAGTPGWITDRGRIYIIHGPADQIDRNPTGGMYQEQPREGTRIYTSFPHERWHYRHLEGIGENITLEFVDKNSIGDYQLTADPTEKEVFFTPGALSRNTDPLTAPADANLRFRMLDQMMLYAKIERPPQVKFKDLEEVVTSRLVRDVLPVRMRTDFIRMTNETLLVPLTISIPRKSLSFKVNQGVHVAEANLYGRVTTLTGRVVQVFEDTIQLHTPESLLAQLADQPVVYQKALPLRTGLYKIVLLIKDVNGGNIGFIEQRLGVPSFDAEELSHSTLILADLIEPAPQKQLGLGQFVIGSTKVRPVVEREFRRDQPLGVYMQVYNLGLDQSTHKPNATIQYIIARGREILLRHAESAAELQGTGSQLTISRLFPLSNLAPGSYQLVVSVTDKNQGQNFQVSAGFRVLP